MLQTISIYLVMPLTPAIAFGVLSRRVTFAGAAASFITGIVLSAVFVVDALLPDKALAARWFPMLHWPLTGNYTYRGFWGTLAITLILFLVSAFTRKTESSKLAATTFEWGAKWEPFQGLADWRLHLAILSLMTLAAYWWMW
jgi:SSS family solute:Na+ symporter